MSGVAEVLAQEANRRAEEDFADREQHKRKNYEYQLQQKHVAKAKAAQARGERHIEMRISGGVQRVDEDAWKEFYDHAAVKPIMETLTRLVREKLFKMRDDTTAQIERMCGAQMRRAGPGGTQHSRRDFTLRCDRDVFCWTGRSTGRCPAQARAWSSPRACSRKSSRRT